MAKFFQKKNFKLPIGLDSYYKKGNVEVVYSEGLTLPVKASVKIFVSTERINIVIDSKDLTYFLSLDMSGLDVQLRTIANQGQNSCSTFYHGTLYRLSISTKKFQVEIFDTETWKQLGTYSLLKEDIDGEDLMFEHNGRSNHLTKEKQFRWIMYGANDSKPLINVILQDGKIKIRCAKYEELQSTLSHFTGIGATGGLLSAALTSLLYSNLFNAIVTSPHLTNYFYIEWNSEKNIFSMNPSIVSVFDKIDSFNLQLKQSRSKILYAGYVPLKNGILGVYEIANDKNIQFILFEN